MKKLILSFILLLGTSYISRAQLLVEHFDYTAGTNLTANGWTAHSGTGTNPISVGATSLTFPTYSSPGIGGSGVSAGNGEDINFTFPEVTTGSAYASFLMRIDTVGGSGYFFHFMEFVASFNYRGRVFFQEDGSNPNAVNFGLSNGSGTGTYDTTPFLKGDTVLVVLKYTIVAGATNDEVSLFVFDPSSSFVVEPATPLIGPLTSATISDLNPGRIGLRQFNNSNDFTIDAIQVDTVWNMATGPAQLAQIDLPITWDDTANVDYTTTPFGGNFSALALDPMNATNNVLEVIKPIGAQTWAGVTLSTPAGLASVIPFTVVENKISAQVYSPASGMSIKLKAEVVGSPAQSVETDMLTTVANGWETLVFDFTNNSPSTPAINYALDYDMLSIFFDFNVPGANDTFYCDSVYFGGNVPTPEFNFLSSDITTEEADASTYELIYTCNNLDANTVTVEVAIDAATTAMIGADFTTSPALPLTITALPFQSITDTILVTIVNDMIGENPEDLVFVFQNAVNAIIGNDSIVEITINDDDNFQPIADINNDDANGEPDSVGNTYWTSGVVLGVDLDGNNGLSFTLWDAEGINIFNFNDVSNYVVTEGDSLLARGEIDFYNGLTEFFVDSITVLNSGNPIPEPMLVQAPGQMTESEPIRINNVQVIDAGEWPNGGSSNVRLLTCLGDTITMRIDSDTDVDDNWAVAPAGLFNLTGIGGQFDNSAPYLDNYQIFPMYFTDLDTTSMPAPSLLINELMADNASSYQDENGDYDDWIEVYNTSAVDMPLEGLYFTNDDLDITKFQIAMGVTEVVPAGGYAIIWADNETTEGPLHANFELDAAGGYVAISYLNGCTAELIDEVDYTALDSNQSFGRETDGGEPWVVFDMATPNAMNQYLSVEEVGNTSVKAWPNPNNGESLYFNQKVSFNLYSLTGQLMMSETNVSSTDLSGLNKGLYLIETTSGDAFRVVVK